ncbi:septum site-determining protein Ssd [Actinoplanes sp. CA-142083]|uniref:septum site-determining protein Ssd n=1 Tax=Actinoplanes sp. CA-142083 TaxID=3239903 RepID=UPI003D8E7EF5
MPTPRLPLVVTADQELLDDLVRLAAAGGTEVVVATDPISASPRITAAPMVVFGADVVVECLRAGLPRHSRTVIATRSEWPHAVDDAARRLGEVHICLLPDGEAWLVDRFASLPHADPPLARTVAVIGGSGGAGASILAGGLAVTAVRAGHRTLLVDGDPLGGGLDVLLGWEQQNGLRWPALARAGGRVDPPELLRALPQRGDLVLLSFARDESASVPSEAMAAALHAGRRARDVIVADLPRQLDDASVLALQTADRALLVVRPELRSLVGAHGVAQTIRVHRDDLAVVVRGPAPVPLPPRDVAKALGLPLAGVLRPEPDMLVAIENGKGPAYGTRGRLAGLCRELLGKLVDQPRNEAAA